MDDHGKSDRPVVPMKSPNKTERSAAEVVEGRGLVKGNTDEQNAPRTQSRTGAPSALDRVREVAKKDRKARFTALMHHVTLERLQQAYQALSKDAAPGTDGVRWEEYGERLDENLQELHSRLRRGAFRACPATSSVPR